MADSKHLGPLTAAYAAKRPEEVAALYDRWSE
ncbi:SAM-dependent methyltransferase, partial [Mesorhizobium sp. M2D.F.Ca.ET.225.01.1.1]